MSQEEEIQYFIASFDKAAEEIKKSISDGIWETAIDLSVAIEQDTPLGKPELWKWPPHGNYEAGTLKAGWQIEKDNAELSTILIYNNVIYAERIEYSAWSTQALEGMMRKNAINFQILLDAKLKAKGLV